MMTDRIVLTGASGMLGFAILRELARRDDVCTLALYRSGPPGKLATNIDNRVINLDDHEELHRTLQAFRPTVFIHAAATGMQTPRADSDAITKINVELPTRLAEAVSQITNCRFVHISSGLAYKDQGRPLRESDPLETPHPYGASKAEAEIRLLAAAQARSFPLTIVRPFSFTGEGDFGTRLFPSLLQSAAEQQLFEMSRGNHVRDHSSVNDIARGVIAAALDPDRNSSASHIFNLGSGDTRRLRELVADVVGQLGLMVDVHLGARPDAENEPMFMVADATHAQTRLRWQPRESVARAVWCLARTSFPSLSMKEPPPDL